MITRLGCMFQDWVGRTRPPAILVTFALTMAALPGAGSGQNARQDAHQAHGAMEGMAAMPMIMATDDHKVFRLIRPTLAAIQIRPVRRASRDLEMGSMA